MNEDCKAAFLKKNAVADNEWNLPSVRAAYEQFSDGWQAALDYARGEQSADIAAYQRAIDRACQAFRKNKSRMWPLKILKEYLAEEKTAIQKGNPHE